MTRRLSSVVAAALCLALGARTAAAQTEAARPEIGKPVEQAQGLARAKKYAEALAALKKADAVPNKSPYETYIIEETRAVAALGAGDDRAAAGAIEAALATKVLPPADAQKRLLSLVQIEYQLKDYAKTVAEAERYYQAGGTDPAPRRLMAQSYYLESDYADAGRTIRQVLDADARAGRPPDEQLLRALADSDFKARNEPGYIDAEERLAAAFPKHEYWAALCRAVGGRESFAPRLRLDLDRVAVAAGAFDQPQQYVAAAELALQAGFPGDAQNFLAKGRAAGVLGTGADAGREQRLAAMAKSQSDDDRKSLAQQAQEAAAAKDGRALEKLGEAYASYAAWHEAAAALEASLKKGVDHPEDAQLHLGMVYIEAGDARAKPLLQGITGTDGSGDLAHLWLIDGGR